MSRAILQQHVNTCLDSSACHKISEHAATASNAARQPSVSLQAASPVQSATKHSFPDTHDQPQGQPRKQSDAFAHLMHSQRQCSQVHNFYLQRGSDGSWHWHWWSSAGARPDTQPVASQTTPPAACIAISASDSSQDRLMPKEVHKAWTSTSQVSGAADTLLCPAD